MGEHLYEVKLTATELRELDSKCSQEVQKVVNTMLAETVYVNTWDIPWNIAAMVEKIVDFAKSKGKLTIRHVLASRCPCCDRRDGYYVYTRNTYLKGFGGRFPTHVKGEPDYSSPKRFIVCDLGRSCIMNTVF